MADVMRPFALRGKVLAGKQNYRAVGVFLNAPGAVEQLLEQFLILDHQDFPGFHAKGAGGESRRLENGVEVAVAYVALWGIAFAGKTIL